MEIQHLALAAGRTTSACIVRPPARTPGPWPTVVLAHGAGTDRTHASLRGWQDALAQAGYVAIVFNFPYRDRGRKLPDPRPVLEDCWTAVLDHVRSSPALTPAWLAIGGRSMGGRMATYVAAHGAPVDALVLLGYPLYPAGKPERLRADHLPRIAAPTLFIQGTRDALADRARLLHAAAAMPRATIHWIEQADHGFHVPRRAGRTDADVQAEISHTMVAWLDAQRRRQSPAAR